MLTVIVPTIRLLSGNLTSLLFLEFGNAKVALKMSCQTSILRRPLGIGQNQQYINK